MAAAGDLEGKTALIAGGAPELVYEASQALARSGARLVITGEAARPGARVGAVIRALGDQAVYARAARGADADWARVVDAAVQQFGRLDVLVWIDAPTELAPLAAMSLEAFRARSSANLKSAFLALKHAVAAIRRNPEGAAAGGSIIFSSTVSRGQAEDLPTGDPTMQRGVRLLSKAAALELGPERIRVNTVLRGLAAQAAPPDVAQRIPLGRFAEPRDFASAVHFLASRKSQFMTGAELVVDGGWSIQ